MFKERLAAGRVLFDGAMGTLLLESFTGLNHVGSIRPADYLNTEDPGRVRAAHLSYLEAGAEIITTNTFCASSIFLSEQRTNDHIGRITSVGVRLAREAIYTLKTQSSRYVAGSIGPSGRESVPSDTDMLVYRAQAQVLLRQADCLLLETFPTIEQADRAATAVGQARQETGSTIPLILSFAPTPAIRSVHVEKWRDIARRFTELGVDYFGVNCGSDTASFQSLVSTLYEGVKRPLYISPSAGIPIRTPDGISYPLNAVRFADFIQELLQTVPVFAVGGCCGTRPEHIRLLCELLAANRH